MKKSQEDNRVKSKETDYVTMFIQNGIFYAFFKKIDVLDFNIANATVRERLIFFEKKAYPCLFDISEVKQITKEARDFMADEGNQLVLASAMVVTSPMLKMMANFYIMVNKPKNPTRLFTDRENAQQWLLQFKNKSFV